jgi:hypothetical protein
VHTLTTLLNELAASIPNPAPVAPPGVSKAVGVVFGYGKWLAYAVCGLAAIVAGARFAIEVRQHGGSSDAARQLLLALVGAGVVSGAVALVNAAVS